ncbi:hypothetical protein BGX27_006233, partial [Mortierella sp. AM989]
MVQETARAAIKRLGVIDSSGRDSKDSAQRMSKSHSDQPDSLPPVWDPVWHSATGSILLKTIQQRERAKANIDEMPGQLSKTVNNMAIPTCLGDVYEALQSYYKPLLFVWRVSGEILPLESCYINLAAVEAPGQRVKDKQVLKKQSATFQRIPSHERTEGTHMASSIPLDELFNQQVLRNGKNGTPKTFLIHGQAGIGKTTL